MPWTWLSQNWQTMISVVGFLFFLWRVHVVFSNFEGWGADLQTVRRDMTTVMTNHIPHLQAEVEKVNDNITGLRGDFREGLTRLSDSINVVLTRMG